MPRRAAMHAQPQRTLKRLVKQYGHELVEDPRRTEALLRDLCGQHTREIFVLVNAQKQRVPADLLAAPKWMPAAATHTRLARILQNKLALTEEAAEWAVAAWAAALETQTPPTRERFQWLPPSLRPALEVEGEPAPQKRQASDSGVKSSQPSVRAAKRRSARSRRAEMRGWQAALSWMLQPIAHVQPGAALASALTAVRRPGLVRKGMVGVGLLLTSALLLWLATTLTGLPSGSLAPQTELVEAQSPPAAPPASAPTAAAQTGDDTGLRTPAETLRRAFPLPTMARVSAADGLFIREGPGTIFARAGHVVLNEVVEVVGFSEDGTWSNIDGSNSGWVSNDFLHFESVESIGVRVQVRVRQLETKPYQAAVRSAPRPDAAVIATLPPTTVVLAVASTVGNAVGWLQIVEPESGWLSLNDVP